MTEGKNQSSPCKLETDGSFEVACTMFWLTGWLFTIGFLHLTFWGGSLAILIWPYDIGVYVRSIIR
jgi:hypothetical protein